MRKAVSLIVGLLLFFNAAASAETAVRSKKIVLENGLTVIVNEMPSTNVSAVYAWVKTGSANEGKYLGSGITHFVEHMIFKGTSRRAPGVISDETKSLGGYINASTSHDFTVFTLSLPRENFIQGVDLIADMMCNAAFDPKEVESEREVILKEMHMLNDRPARKLEELLNASVYRIHPYRLPIIGQEDIFKAITRNDLLDYYHTYYAPNNIILAVSGQFTAEEVLPIIKAKFGDARARSIPLRDIPLEPEQIIPRFVEETYATDLYRVALAYQGVPLMHGDLFALDVLASAMGSGHSSRLYRRLYEDKQWVDSIEAWNDTPIDRGYFAISFLMKEDRRTDVLKEIRSIISDLQRDGLTSEELMKVKRRVVVENIRSREVASGMAYRTAMEEAFAGDYLFSDSYVKGVQSVTNEDIKRVARHYFNEQCLTQVGLIPVGTAQAVSRSQTVRTVETEKVLLPNGLTLLVKEDNSLPMISIHLLMRAGIEQEPEELAGLAVLTGAVWGKAYIGTTSGDLSHAVEVRGGTLGSGSGKNTWGLSMTFLSEDWSFALDTLERLVKTPAFQNEVIDRERQQLLTSIAGRKDSVMRTAYKELSESLFLTHPFRREGIGTEDSLQRITRKEVVDFYEHFAVPSNMVLAVFGDINKETIKKDIQSRLGSISNQEVKILSFSEAEPQEQRARAFSMNKEQSVVLYGFRAPDIYSSEGAALEVAVNVLSSSLGGRLFKRIREDLGKSYALGGSYAPGTDAGMVAFFSLTTCENIEKVRSIIEEELSRIAREPVTEKELHDAKVYLKGDRARDLETLTAQAETAATDEMLGLGYDFGRNYDKRIDAVTLDDLLTVARKYFRLGNCSVVVVKGEPAPADASAR